MSLQELATKFTEVKSKMMAEGQEALKTEFQKVFEAYPKITVIKWNQYTPYFNDGDTCEFGVGSFVISNALNAEEVSSYGEYEGETEGEWAEELWGDTAKEYPLIRDLENFCNTGIGKEILLMTFEDHSIVTATCEGFDIEEYEHE